MLIDKYLSGYQFNELHSIELVGASNGVYRKMLCCDFTNSCIIRFLCRLRGMPKKMFTIDHMTKLGFIKLDENPGTEILFGMITDNPTFNSCISTFSPDDFLLKSDVAIIKAVINFHVFEKGNSKYCISTETRVWCGNKKLKAKFRLYWLFVKPFSQLIRKLMLRQIKRQIIEV